MLYLSTYLKTKSYNLLSPNLLGNIFSTWYIKRKEKETLASKHKTAIQPSKQRLKVPVLVKFLASILLHIVSILVQAKLSPSGHRMWVLDYEIYLTVCPSASSSLMNMALDHYFTHISFFRATLLSLGTRQDFYVRKQPLRIDQSMLFSFMYSNQRH